MNYVPIYIQCIEEVHMSSRTYMTFQCHVIMKIPTKSLNPFYCTMLLPSKE